MDLTETPDALSGADEERPDFDTWESPVESVRGERVRERVFDVVLQLREPTTVAVVAERADCDTETAREYLRWFAEMGIVREHSGRPVQYERNESYLRWRRIESIRQVYSRAEIVDRLRDAVEAVTEYREQFDADSPAAVSLADAPDGETVERRWRALSEWQTLERRVELLDAARRETADSPPSAVDV